MVRFFSFICIFLVVCGFFVFAEEKKVLEEDEFTVGDIKISGVKGASIEKEGDLTNFVLEDGNILKYSSGDKTYEFPGLKKGAKFVFDKDGKLVRAEFSPSEDFSYDIGDYKGIFVPKDSNFYFKEGKVLVGILSNSQIKNPELIPEGGSLEYFTNKGKTFKLDNGVDFEGALFFDSSGSYIERPAKFEGLSISNEENQKLYFDFNGEKNQNYDAPYLSLDRENGKFILATNGETDSPKVVFEKGNSYVKIEDNDYVTLKVLGNSDGSSFSTIPRDSEGLTPGGESINSFELTQDGFFFHFDEDKNEFLTKRVAEYDKKDTSPLDIAVLRVKDNGEVANYFKGGERLVIGNNKMYAFGKDPSLIYSSVSYTGTDSVFHSVSNRLERNYLDASAFERITGVKLEFYGRNAESGLTSSKIQMLMDFYEQAPENIKKAISEFNILGDGLPVGYVRQGRSSVKREFVEDEGKRLSLVPGLTQVDSTTNQIYLRLGTLDDSADSLGRGGMSTLFHESGHVLHFAAEGLKSNFMTEWQKIEGSYSPSNTRMKTFDTADKGFSYGYGSSNYYEDIATFVEFSKRPSYWANLISDSNRYSTIYRGKIALLTREGFIDYNDYKAIFDNAKLASSRDSIGNYIAVSTGELKSIQVAAAR